MGRFAALLVVTLLGGIVVQLWFAAELRELEAMGPAASAAALDRATSFFWVGGAAIFGSSLSLAALFGWIAARTIRLAAFPPPGAEWLGARRTYQGPAARRVGWGGLLLASFLALASLAGLALVGLFTGFLDVV